MENSLEGNMGPDARTGDRGGRSQVLNLLKTAVTPSQGRTPAKVGLHGRELRSALGASCRLTQKEELPRGGPRGRRHQLAPQDPRPSGDSGCLRVVVPHWPLTRAHAAWITRAYLKW